MAHESEIERGAGLEAVKDRVFCGSDEPILHHVCLFVSDMDASVEFYTTGLGLKVREAFDDIVGVRPTGRFPFRLASVFLQAGDGRYIELHPAGDGDMSPPGFPLNHLALSVADVDAAYDRAVAAGALPFGFAMEEAHWDGTPLDVVMTGQRSEPMRMAFLQGPSGELIELYQAAAANNASDQFAT
ncbi:MAG: VOC family protein [Henriciella sp.]|nr:VOC family protein [Henriciella sp.]